MLQRSEAVPRLTVGDLPSPLREGLHRLAARFRLRGIRLVVFGSFARGEARPWSDLDLGFLWEGARRPEEEAELFRAVAELPTIRRIDLVDLGAAGETLQREAAREGIPL
ncbi:nucleotidyltransferase domain-containing protein [Methylacidimicrobium sp. B4]|uniref:nucleotidyltransferase domain-containing protein n=1 Tax=Methylacidimicrobium sp. B4 TaxID=2796139 RepID=UPI001A905F61|nr:nucleotidyltransferase domain-containing protein [Methylacidimicrobium sp. B4]QSR84401.1 nucleotidyltransferase domain-containing protein [Methylacidimicrobium sp. B4]